MTQQAFKQGAAQENLVVIVDQALPTPNKICAHSTRDSPNAVSLVALRQGEAQKGLQGLLL
jgi:hypothetical protein